MQNPSARTAGDMSSLEIPLRPQQIAVAGGRLAVVSEPQSTRPEGHLDLWTFGARHADSSVPSAETTDKVTVSPLWSLLRADAPNLFAITVAPGAGSFRIPRCLGRESVDCAVELGVNISGVTLPETNQQFVDFANICKGRTEVGFGGGGSSDVRFGSGSDSERLLVAGGGGGAGGSSGVGSGGPAGYPDGATAPDNGGGGGTQAAGGTGVAAGAGDAGTDGALFQGGNGNQGGGGAASGYYGGGGGSGETGGGGGSSSAPFSISGSATFGTAVSTGNGSVQLRWLTKVRATAAADGVEVAWSDPDIAGVAGYVVSSAETGDTVCSVDSGTATTCKVTGLASGGEASFLVQALNTDGVELAATFTNAVVVVGPPGAPAITNAKGGAESVDLAWTPPTDHGGKPISGYQVQQSTDGTTWVTASSQPTGSGTTFTVGGLTNGTSCQFQVAAINSEGAGPWSEASSPAQPGTPPSAPSISRSSAANAEATIEWKVPSTDGGLAVSGYTTQQSTDGSTWTDTTPQPSGVETKVTATNLTNGMGYQFHVSVQNAAASSDWSVASPPVTPEAPAMAPVEPSATTPEEGPETGSTEDATVTAPETESPPPGVRGSTEESADADGSAPPPTPTSPAPVRTVAVAAGDSLWRLARAYLGPTATNAQIDAEWRAWYGANRDVVGPDPNLIHPGTVLTLP